MKLVPLIFMLGFFVPVVRSQSPGGINGAIHWYGPDTLHHLPALRSYTGDKTSVLTFENATVRTLNFHPSLLFLRIRHAEFAAKNKHRQASGRFCMQMCNW